MLRELGEELQQARERRGASIADAQAETKIRSRYLEALEQGRFDILPGDVYTKGFLKAYAEYLGLDGRAMVDRYKAWQRSQAEAEREQAEQQAGVPEKKRRPEIAAAAPVAKPVQAAQPKAPERTPEQARALAQAQPKLESTAPRSGNGLPRRMLYTAVVLLLVAGIAAGSWLALRNAGPRQAGGGASTPGATAPTTNPAGGSTQPGTGGATQPGTGGGSGGGSTASGLTLERGASDNQYIMPVAIKGAGSEPLELAVTARGDCWIRLERSGQETVEETLHAGDTRQWDFGGQASLKLGNPPAVGVKVNDAALPDSNASYAITYVFTRP